MKFMTGCRKVGCHHGDESCVHLLTKAEEVMIRKERTGSSGLVLQFGLLLDLVFRWLFDKPFNHVTVCLL